MLSNLTSMGMWIGILIVAAIEANALFGKMGPITTVRGVITSSVILTVVMGIIAGL